MLKRCLKVCGACEKLISQVLFNPRRLDHNRYPGDALRYAFPTHWLKIVVGWTSADAIEQ